MVVSKELTKNERRLVALLSEGNSVPRCAKKLRIAQRTVYDMVNRLIARKVIYRVPGTKSPALYEIVGQPDICESANNSGSVASSQECSEGKTPSKYPMKSRTHSNGRFDFLVHEVGTHENELRDALGFSVGSWTHVSTPRGRKDYHGFIRVASKDSEIAYLEGNRGSKTFTIWPSEEYMELTKELTPEEVHRRFLTKIEILIEILSLNGWKLEYKTYTGKYEYAFPEHDLIQFKPLLDRHPEVKDEHSIFNDGSHGVFETETTELEDAKIISHLPDEIRSVNAAVSENNQRLDEMEATMVKVISVLKMVVTGEDLLASATAKSLETRTECYVSQYIPKDNIATADQQSKTTNKKHWEGYQ